MEALIQGENQAADRGKGISRCPVCRRKVVRSSKPGTAKPGTSQVVLLELKLKTKSASAKGKEKATA